MDSSPLTLKSIAKIVGCSDTTVSRVLSGKSKQYRISAKTTAEVLRLAQELNFVPNPLAASLRTRRTMTVGLVLPDIANPFFAQIAPFVQRESRKAGYTVLLANTEENSELEIDSVEMLRKRNIDGLIIAPTGQSPEHLLSLYRAGLPMVLIDRYFPECDIPFVVSDNEQGAFEAVTFLVENRHRYIACIQGLPHTTLSRERVNGYRRALNHAGINMNEDWIVGDSNSEENGYLEMRLLLKDARRPTAILALSNLIALGALRAIGEERLQVPDDISVIAFDDLPYFNFFATPLTTVAQQAQEIGRVAMKLLYRQMTQTGAEIQSVKLPIRLVKRDSVRML